MPPFSSKRTRRRAFSSRSGVAASAGSTGGGAATAGATAQPGTMSTAEIHSSLPSARKIFCAPTPSKPATSPPRGRPEALRSIAPFPKSAA